MQETFRLATLRSLISHIFTSFGFLSFSECQRRNTGNVTVCCPLNSWGYSLGVFWVVSPPELIGVLWYVSLRKLSGSSPHWHTAGTTQTCSPSSASALPVLTLHLSRDPSITRTWLFPCWGPEQISSHLLRLVHPRMLWLLPGDEIISLKKKFDSCSAFHSITFGLNLPASSEAWTCFSSVFPSLCACTHTFHHPEHTPLCCISSQAWTDKNTFLFIEHLLNVYYGRFSGSPLP